MTSGRDQCWRQRIELIEDQALVATLPGRIDHAILAGWRCWHAGCTAEVDGSAKLRAKVNALEGRISSIISTPGMRGIAQGNVPVGGASRFARGDDATCAWHELDQISMVRCPEAHVAVADHRRTKGLPVTVAPTNLMMPRLSSPRLDVGGVSSSMSIRVRCGRSTMRPGCAGRRSHAETGRPDTRCDVAIVRLLDSSRCDGIITEHEVAAFMRRHGHWVIGDAAGTSLMADAGRDERADAFLWPTLQERVINDDHGCSGIPFRAGRIDTRDQSKQLLVLAYSRACLGNTRAWSGPQALASVCMTIADGLIEEYICATCLADQLGWRNDDLIIVRRERPRRPSSQRLRADSAQGLDRIEAPSLSRRRENVMIRHWSWPPTGSHGGEDGWPVSAGQRSGWQVAQLAYRLVGSWQGRPQGVVEQVRVRCTRWLSASARVSRTRRSLPKIGRSLCDETIIAARVVDLPIGGGGVRP